VEAASQLIILYDSYMPPAAMACRKTPNQASAVQKKLLNQVTSAPVSVKATSQLIVHAASSHGLNDDT
jgi:hypothetical protein